MNTAPIHGTTEHLNARIAAASSPSKPDEITHFGIFTADVRVDLAVRHLYVSRGCDVLPHQDDGRSSSRGCVSNLEDPTVEKPTKKGISLPLRDRLHLRQTRQLSHRLSQSSFPCLGQCL
jgi:hypothetical protein